MPYGAASILFSDEAQSPGASPVTFTPATAPTIGSTVAVCVRQEGKAGTNAETPADWTRGSAFGTAARSGVWFYRQCIDNGAGSPDFSAITVVFTTAPSNWDMSWVEIPGATPIEDQAITTTSGTGTAATLGTQTPTIAYVVALVAVVPSGTHGGIVSATEGFTLFAVSSGSTGRFIVGYKIIEDGAATGAPIITWTTSRLYQAGLILLRSAFRPEPPQIQPAMAVQRASRW